MTGIATIIIYAFLSIVADGDHYRGGFITWKPQYPHITNQDPVAIVLIQRHVWRRSSEPCNDSTIVNKDYVGNDIYVNCISNCSSKNNLAAVRGQCVAYSIQNDWSAGEISTVVNISANMSFEAAFRGGAWISTLKIGAKGLWSVSTAISTIPRSDGTYNTAPSTSMSSIKSLQVGFNYTWEIPVADTDGDLVRCRWAKRKPIDECAAVCNGLPNATLTEYPCSITYTAEIEGLWVVALKIEDFESSSQTIPLSGSSIQFIVNVIPVSGICTKAPFYYGERAPNTCTTIDVGTTVTEIAQFSLACENTTLTEVEMYKPAGMIVSALKLDPLNSSLYTMSTTWTPTSIQLGTNLVCYTPLDSFYRQGNQVCIKYFVNDIGSNLARSKYIDGSMKPIDEVCPNQNVWSIQYSHQVHRPSLDAYIRFYSNSTNEVVYQINVHTNLADAIYSGTDLTFFTAIRWNISERYYILFDSSIVTDPDICGPQSPAITDPRSWTFKIVKPSCCPPEVTLIPNTSPLFPMQIRRSEDLYITSKIILDCNGSLSIITKWTINNCADENCSNSREIHPDLLMNFSELFIPARTLSYGTYRLTLTVTINISSHLISFAYAYVTIIPSNIQVNLILFGTSMVTLGDQEDLLLDPGRYSFDPDQKTFPVHDWTYAYSYRMGNESFVKSFNHSNSSLLINGTTLSQNRIYQFIVHMINRRNTSIEARGYLLVHIKPMHQYRIAIGCAIAKQCHSANEYRSLNPQRQLKLVSICIDNCSVISKMIWNVYQGSSLLQWTLFNQTNLYENLWFFGRDTKTFTVTNPFFQISPTIKYWRFEVIYSFPSDTSSSTLNFIRNDPPRNGSCSIDPPNGTTSTLFNISCINWFDEDEIQDYALYVESPDPLQRLMIAFSSVSNFQVQLSTGNPEIFVLNLVIFIRDKLDCLTEWNLSSIVVRPNREEISILMDYFQSSVGEINSHPMARRLTSGNQNVVAQIITSLSPEFDVRNLTDVMKNNHEEVVNRTNDISVTNIFVSSLGNSHLAKEYLSLNEAMVKKYTQLLNIYAKIRDFWIQPMANLAIFRLNSIQLQASALVQLTRPTNQLTQTTAILAFTRCHQFSQILYSLANQSSYEDVRSTGTLISQCLSNSLTAVYGPLQKRMSVLGLDHVNSNELQWIHLSHRISNQSAEAISLLTAALNLHLNINQNLTITTPSILMSLKSASLQSFLNQSFEQIEDTRIAIPANFTCNITNETIISFRTIVQPLSFPDRSQLNLNLSRSVSISILDQNNRELFIQTTSQSYIEFLIPRDPNLFISPMILQNVISMKNSFGLKYIYLTSNLSISIHFEIRPLEKNLAYLFLYQFDSFHSIDQIAERRVFCPANLTKDGLYTFFIDNQRTKGHQAVIYGLRELSSAERDDVCSNSAMIDSLMQNKEFNFTSNYESRVYTSGCYYLDENNHWQSDGLLVGPKTNPYQTHCYSTHLTTIFKEH